MTDRPTSFKRTDSKEYPYAVQWNGKKRWCLIHKDDKEIALYILWGMTKADR